MTHDEADDLITDLLVLLRLASDHYRGKEPTGGAEAFDAALAAVITKIRAAVTDD